MIANNEPVSAPLRRALVLHPFLLAAYPVVYLWAHNLREGVAVRDVVVPLAIAIGAATLLTLAGTLVLRNGPKAGLVVSILVVLFFSYGYLYRTLEGRAIGGITVGRHLVLLSLWFVLGVAGVALTIRARGRFPALTRIMNVTAAGLVAINLVTIGLFEVKPNPSGTKFLEQGDARLSPSAAPVARRPRRPDVFYIILEEYAGERTLLDQYGYDNRPFLDFLASKGFYVAHESTTNYPRTELSVASSLNMKYLDFLSRRYGTDSGDFTPLLTMLKDNQLARVMKSIGYRYIHVGSWWTPTATSPLADVNVTFGGLSEFASVLYQTTALAPVATDDARHTEWKRVQFQFEALERIRRFKGPRFVFAHLLTPHDPIVFDRNGHYVSEQQERSRPREQGYVDQLIYTNKRVMEVVNKLLEVPPAKRPVIVIQSDEGPFSGAPTTWGANPNPLILQRKFEILNAYFLPGVPLEESGLTPTLTPVNSFRLVLDLYFGANLPLLPDRNYVFRNLKHIYEFREVTALVRPVVRTSPLIVTGPSP